MTTKSFPIELDTRGEIALDARRLVDTRMLVAGSSGSGKSYLMRVIAEQAANRLQTIVLDPEGEYTTLREKVDAVIVGPEGEALPTVPTAPKLARKLLELQVSAVVDLYDLKIGERRAFVRRFLDSLMSAPKKLWRPLILMLDEAHKFCPERSSGQAESTDAVITLLSQGRKRGFCGILSTQRLQKLHKDAAAETMNKLIGRTTLDLDIKRARDTLGVPKSDEAKLRALKPGNWFGFGPAFIDLDGVCTFKGRRAETTHPQAGNRQNLRAPGPSARIRKVLPELAELPQEAEREANDLATARKRIAELERDNRKLAKGHPAPDPAATQKIVDMAVKRATEKQQQTYDRLMNKVARELGKIDTAVDKINEASRQAAIYAGEDVLPFAQDDVPKKVTRTAGKVVERSPGRARVRPSNGEKRAPGGGKGRILVALASVGDHVPRAELAILANLSPKAGTYSDYLSSLRKDELIDGDGGDFWITDLGIATLGHFKSVPISGDALIEKWMDHCGGGKGRIFAALAEAGDAGLSRTDLAAAAELNAKAGTYSDYLSYWRRLGIIEGRGHFRLAEIFRR